LKLLVKFNLLFIILFGAGVGTTALISRGFLRRNARDEVVKQAELMMETATSTRSYTSLQIKPLLEPQQQASGKFLPQVVPAFAAISTFNYLRRNYPEYSYREATLNPTNLSDRALDWEADIINYFRNHPEERLLIGERDTPTGRALYLGIPIRAEHSCLECHSTPQAAPASMIASYGSDHGFGWKENAVVASQIVSVPMIVPEHIADQAFGTLIAALAATSLLTLVIIDAALFFMVIRPVGQLAQMADRVSKGELDIPELPIKGGDEISHLTASFNRMFLSLVKAIRMLED
jgi:HAMP domain-containing protein